MFYLMTFIDLVINNDYTFSRIISMLYKNWRMSMATPNNNFALRLKQLRKENNITQLELSRKLGVVRTAITNYETGRAMPDPTTLNVLAKIFNVSIDYLMGTSSIRNNLFVENAVMHDEELADFWEKMKERENLKILFKQTKNMSENDVATILRIIKAIEDEEDKKEGL